MNDFLGLPKRIATTSGDIAKLKKGELKFTNK